MFDLLGALILILEIALGLALLAWLFRFVPKAKSDERNHKEYFVDNSPRYQTPKPDA